MSCSFARVVFAMVLTFLLPPANSIIKADDFTWEATPVTTRWGGSANWAGTLGEVPDDNTDTATVSGVPTNGFDPLLDVNYTIGALTILANGDVNLGDGTDNFRLIVQDNGGESGLTLIGGGGSELNVFNSAELFDFDTDDLTIDSGGDLNINSAVVQVDRAADINAGGLVNGNGQLRIDGTVNAVNNGEIRASGGTLTVSASSTAEIDLDGDGSEGGEVAAFSNSRLIIDIPVQGPVFNGTIDINSNAEVQINSPISLQSTHVIDFSGGSGTATYSGSPFTMRSGSIMDINSGTAVMAADFTADAGSIINFSADTTLQFDAPATISSPDTLVDTSNIGYIVNDAVNIGTGTGTFDWDAFQATSTTRVNDTGTLTINVATVEADPGDSFDATIELFSGDLSVTVDDGAWEMNGTLEMRNSTGSVPKINGSDLVVGGNVNATGTGRSDIQVPSIWNASSNTSVSANAVLVLGNSTGDTVTYAGGSFTGAGELEQGGDATVTADTTIDTAIFDWDRFGTTDTTVNSGVTFTINSTLADPESGTLSVNSGTLAVNTPWSLDVGTLILENTGGGTATLNGSELTVQSNAAVEMRGSSVSNADVRVNGALTVSGGSTADLNGQIVFGSSANVSVPVGETLDLNGFTEFQGGSHNGGGRVNQNADSRVTANTVINYAEYNWDGPSFTTVTVDPNVTFVLNVNELDPGIGNTDIDITLRVGNGATVTVNTPGPWGIDSGVVDLQSPPSLAPTARINGSNFELSSFGRVQGNGRFTTNVRNAGTFAPGTSSGNIVVNGSYLQTATGELEMEIETLVPITGYDQLSVAGLVSLAGTIDVTPIGAYVDPAAPGDFDLFALVLAGSRNGTFDDFVYDGATLALSFGLGDLDRYHVGDGLFRILSYFSSGVDLINYQALPGDANGNGIVDEFDFGIWNANKFTAGTDWTTGDFNGDGFTDGADFGIWNANKGTSVSAGSAFVDGRSNLQSVPEPQALVLVALTGLAFLRRTRPTA